MAEAHFILVTINIDSGRGAGPYFIISGYLNSFKYFTLESQAVKRSDIIILLNVALKKICQICDYSQLSANNDFKDREQYGFKY